MPGKVAPGDAAASTRVGVAGPSIRGDMRLPILLAAVALVALGACRRNEPTRDTQPNILVTGADTVPGTGSASELRGMLARWTATRAGRDYEFTVQRGCFCGEEWRRPVTVRVQESAVASVKDAETGAASTLDYQWPTIEEFYAQLIAQAEGGSLRPATYAGAGYPVQFTIGAIEVDAGSTFTITRVSF